MKKALPQLRLQVAAFKELCEKYPNSKEYKHTLVVLQQEEVDLINKIGRKK
jgi:hypothetical protein